MYAHALTTFDLFTINTKKHLRQRIARLKSVSCFLLCGFRMELLKIRTAKESYTARERKMHRKHVFLIIVFPSMMDLNAFFQ